MKFMLQMSSSAVAQQLSRYPAMPKVQFLNPIFSTLKLAVTVSIWDELSSSILESVTPSNFS